MIILDSEGQHDEKRNSFVAGPTIRRPERVAARSSSPLPDYETSQAQHYSYHKLSLRERASSRFWRNLFIAMAIYITLSVAIGIPLIVLKVLRRPHQYLPPPPSLAFAWNTEEPPFSSPLSLKNGVLVHNGNATCDKWDSVDVTESNGLFVSRTSYNFTAKGILAIRSTVLTPTALPEDINGTLTVDINPNAAVKKAAFFVTVQGATPGLTKGLHVCFQSTRMDRGLLIYVPTNFSYSDNLWLDIRVLLPQPSSCKLNRLVTYLPGFGQQFGDLHRLLFDSLSLEGSRFDVNFKSLRARKLFVRNSMGSIAGKFNVTESIRLVTRSGPIHANVTLVHDSTHETPTFLSFDTMNSDIRAQVSLSTPPSFSLLSKPPPRFIAHLKTLNAPLGLEVTHDGFTQNPPLSLRVLNHAAQTKVSIDSRYEGTFDLQTKLAPVVVSQDASQPVLDPAGQNRAYNHIYDHKSESRAYGWVGWGERPKSWDPEMQGHVEVVSSLSPVSVQFGAGSRRTRRYYSSSKVLR